MIELKINAYIEYCQDQKGLSENSLQAYQQDLRVFQNFLKKHPAISNISSGLILEFHYFLKNKKTASPTTIRRRVISLKSYFKWLVETQDNASSPFQGLKLDLHIPIRLPRPIDRPTLSLLFRSTKQLTIPNLDTLHKKISTSKSDSIQMTGLITRVLLVTGLRIGEITRVKLTDVYNGGSVIRVRGKGNRERTVYVKNANLLIDLQAYLQKRHCTAKVTDYLFINTRGNRLTEAAFRKRLRSISKKLGIEPYVTPHMFRHSAATLLIEEGVDIRMVQRLLGHASITTTEIYTKVSDNSLISAIERADTLEKVDF